MSQHNELEVQALSTLESTRPPALRAYDQIAMHGEDLLAATKLAARHLVGRNVAFVGDHDGTSILLGILSSYGLVEMPRRMTLIDFDERVLDWGSQLAETHGFADRFNTRLYNVFDQLPMDMLGAFDTFYTNPPYGASNEGDSARLFISRGCELTSGIGSTAHIIIPDDKKRPWTCRAMSTTIKLLEQCGWCVKKRIRNVHAYHLDDDPELMSALVILKHQMEVTVEMPWIAHAVAQEEIPYFYGRNVQLPYPKYISGDGDPVWPNQVEQ